MNRLLSHYSKKSNLVNFLSIGDCYCGLCMSVFLDKYAEDFFTPHHLHELRKQNNVYGKRLLHLGDIDLINKGKVFESLIYEVKQVDPFDEVNVRKFSGLVRHLECFFNKEYLKKELKDTYAEAVMLALNRRKEERKREVRQKEIRQKESNKDRKALKDFRKAIKDARKVNRDTQRSRFLFKFNPLNPIEKLKVILDGMDIPLQSIPESYLFNPSLKLRFQVHKEFNKEELSYLIKIFGGTTKKNKKKAWKKILKVLK